MGSGGEAIAKLASEMADDDSHGYSQKPPYGRWGPDYDCSSLIYEIASAAGYPVGRGGEKVRFTGTMVEDFKDAGFQILPFANVGLGELEIGDILLNLALHAEVYVGDGQFAGAQSSELGTNTGMPGDQTGQEITKQPAYVLDKGWDYVLRAPGDEKENENEGDDMPYNMGQPVNGWQGRNSMGSMPTWPAPNYTYGQGQQYPQGNLGQMNGYSQANAGGYGQSWTPNQGFQQGQGGPQVVMANGIGIEGAKNYPSAPGSTVYILDATEKMAYVKASDQQGFPSLRVFKLEECSEDIPQHHEGPVSREEFNQLMEMVQNVQKSVSGEFANQSDGSHANGSSNQSGSGRGNRNS